MSRTCSFTRQGRSLEKPTAILKWHDIRRASFVYDIFISVAVDKESYVLVLRISVTNTFATHPNLSVTTYSEPC